jgi:hypothetical protein
MEVTLPIPDDIASRMGTAHELSRRALESLAAEEYKCGRVTKPDVRRLLGFETSLQINDFLRAHDIFEEYTLEDLQRDRDDLRRLGL